MLTIVKGPRGAGKTAWVVRELLTFRRAPIVTNIKLGRWDEIRVLRLRNPKFGPHDTRHYKRRWVTERVFILKPPKNVTFVSSADMTVPKLIRIAQDLRRERVIDPVLVARACSPRASRTLLSSACGQRP